MADPLRIKANTPLQFVVSEPHPDPEHPGNSPVLKSFVMKPGVNELNETNAAVYKAWASTAGQGFVASPDDVKAGNTDGKLYEMSKDEPETEFGFQPALDRATASTDGSTVKDPGPVAAIDMKTGTSDASAAPVLTSAAPLKVPATADAAGQSAPAKVQAAPVVPASK